MRWGPQQLTERQKEWLMGRALKYGHGWLTSVGGGWTNENDIYNSRDLPRDGWGGGERKERGYWEARGAGNSHPRTRSPFSLGRRAVWLCVFSSYLIIAPTPKPVVTPSEPNFWTHSLQIHCNGSAGPRSCLSLGLVQKTRPYNNKCKLLTFTQQNRRASKHAHAHERVLKTL